MLFSSAEHKSSTRLQSKDWWFEFLGSNVSSDKENEFFGYFNRGISDKRGFSMDRFCLDFDD